MVNAEVKTDSWGNLLSGFGTHRDPSSYNAPQTPENLTQKDLDNIYQGDGIGRRVVDIFAEEMTRKWVKISGDKGDERLKQLADLDAKREFNRALRWAGLYGGAIVVMLINDGQSSLDAPLNESTVRSVDDLIVYDRHQVRWQYDTISTDPQSDYFGRAEILTVQPITGAQFTVHRSRVLLFDGEDVPDRVRQQNNGWGDSRLQPVYRALGRYAEGLGATSSILRDFILPVLSMSNLSDMIASGQEDVVRKRLEILGLSRSVLNVLLIDADEEQYHKSASAVGGIDKLLQELKHNLAACTGIPQTKLFGRAPEGMNATGESDTRGWYDVIAAEQEDTLLPQLTQLVYLMDLAAGGEPSDREITFAPLWQMDAKQKSEIRKTNVEAATMALEWGLVDEETAQGWVVDE